MSLDWQTAASILWDLRVSPHLLRCRVRAAFAHDGTWRWAAPRMPARLRLLDGAPLRAEVDVTVTGFAYPAAPSTTRGMVAIDCGDVSRRVQVFGPRVATVDDGAFVVSSPASFDRVLLSREHAYGGECRGAHYPRNAHGRGFVLADARGDFPLPLLEEASDLLVEERLLVPSPDLWWRQPLPATFDELGAADFPRVLSKLLVPASSWDGLAREPSLPERASGDLEEPYDLGRGSARYFANEAPSRSRLRRFEAGTAFVVAGCRPDGESWSGKLPRIPAVALAVEGRRVEVDVRVQALELATHTRELFMTLGFDAELPRGFIPGIHKRIPIEVELEGRGPAAYPTPPTIREQMTGSKGSIS